MRHATRLAPACGMRLKSPRERVGVHHIGIAVDRKAMAVVMSQQRLQKERNGVIAKIRRHIADTYSPFWRGRLPGARRNMSSGSPSLVLIKDELRAMRAIAQ